MEPQRQFMEAAIEAAKTSASNGDYGIGAVVVKDGKIISTGYETLKSSNDPVNGCRDRRHPKSLPSSAATLSSRL